MHEIDLDRYAARIGFCGEFAPTRAVLDQILAHHTSSIPFENLDVLLSRPIDLDLKAIERKFVVDQRGGYCFEQNTLMLAVLEQIGFEVVAMAGRVRLGLTRETLPPRTHLFLVVTIDGEPYIADVGAGGFSLTGSIRLVEDEEQETPHEPRRIVRDGPVRFHQGWTGKEWVDIYEFTEERMPMIDRQIGNWWTSTNPNSKFKRNIMASRSDTDGRRKGILNSDFTIRRGGEILHKETIRDSIHLLELLENEFNLRFPVGTEFVTLP